MLRRKCGSLTTVLLCLAANPSNSFNPFRAPTRSSSVVLKWGASTRLHGGEGDYLFSLESAALSAAEDTKVKATSDPKGSPMAFTEALAPRILEYLKTLEAEASTGGQQWTTQSTDHSGSSQAPPVVRLATPRELEAAFVKEAGVSIDLLGSEATNGVEMEALLEAAQVAMKYSVRTGSPMFNNQLYGAADPVGIAGEWLTAALNTNVHTYEVAPVFTLMEKALLAKFAQVVGGAYVNEQQGGADAHEGLIVPGGSIANMYGMQLARHRLFPQCKAGGNAAAGAPLVALTSSEAHYSYLKAANLLGLGTDNLIKVQVDPSGAMDPHALDIQLSELKTAGKLPFFVGATAGSTVLGAFDPIDKLADVCSKHGVWLHVDGAWGGAALFSRRERSRMIGTDRADSACFNPHKMLGAPLQASLFIHRNGLGSLQAANGANAAYLFQPDKNNGELDMGDMTIQCGRKADSMKIWLMWRALGDLGVERRVDHCVDMINYMAERVDQMTDSHGRRCFVKVLPQSYANLCFYLIPPSMRDELAPNPTIQDLTPDQVASISKVSPVVKDRMQRTGKGLIGFQPVNGYNNCWRMVVAGAKEYIMGEGEVDTLLADMLAAAEDL